MLDLKQPLRIVTRKSMLAMWQAEFVKHQLQTLYPSLPITLIGVSTEGDKIIDIPLTKLGGKGLFVKELEEVLLRNEADIAVHSMKDVPSDLCEGLIIAAILERADARDALISNQFASLAELPSGALVGTSSLRRQAQLLHLRPDLTVKSLRGNVDTRLKKLDNEEFSAIILAVAGLERLGFKDRITEIFSPQHMLPGVGQGALGIECRSIDIRSQTLIAPLHHINTNDCLTAERSLNQALNGSCQSPIAAYATLVDHNILILQGRVALPNGKTVLKAQEAGTIANAFELGKHVANALLEQGAGDIIHACKI